METILSFAWEGLNTPAGLGAVAGLFLLVLNHVYAKKPAWKKFEGTIISAIRLAEKNIPDDANNKSLARLDDALGYVLKVYETANGKKPSRKVRNELLEGIQMMHSKLESAGLLKGGKKE